MILHFCRRRIAKLVCDLLALPRLPASLVEHLLAEQTKIWPQETFRWAIFNLLKFKSVVPIRNDIHTHVQD